MSTYASQDSDETDEEFLAYLRRWVAEEVDTIQEVLHLVSEMERIIEDSPRLIETEYSSSVGYGHEMDIDHCNYVIARVSSDISLVEKRLNANG